VKCRSMNIPSPTHKLHISAIATGEVLPRGKSYSSSIIQWALEKFPVFKRKFSYQSAMT